MITKTAFVATMERIQAQYRAFEELDRAFSKFEGDNSFFPCEVLDIEINLLNAMFGCEEDDWFGYFLLECDWVNELCEVPIWNDDPNTTPPIWIDSWETLYDYLMGQKNEK